jgi:ankyrin repeat protein
MGVETQQPGSSPFAHYYGRDSFDKSSFSDDDELSNSKETYIAELTIKSLGECFKDSEEDIWLAIEQENYDEVVSIINSNPDLIKSINDEGKTFFHVAIESDNCKIVNFLLDKIVSKNNLDLKKKLFEAKDKEGNTPLHKAAMSSFDVLSLLLKNLDDEKLLEIQNNEGNTPLHEAVYTRNFQVMELLYEYAPNALGIKNERNKTPCDLALELGFVDIIKFFVVMDSDNDKIAENIKTFLCLWNKAKEGDLKSIEELAELNHVYIRAQEECGYTLMHILSSQGKIEAIKRLYELDRELNKELDSLLMVQSCYGSTVMHIVAWRNNIELIECFYTLEPELLFVEDHNGTIPLQIAQDNKNIEAEKTLLELGPNLDDINFNL